MKCIFLLFISVGVYAQNYVLTKSTCSGLGGSAGSSNYLLKSAAGQSVTGESKDADYIEQAGFYTYSTVKYVGIEEAGTQLIPKVFTLLQPYPNPIAKVVTIKYGVPRLSRVSIRVYDVTGRVVRALVDCDNKAGFYNVGWDGKSDQGAQLVQGIYFIRMTAPDFKSTRKLIILR